MGEEDNREKLMLGRLFERVYTCFKHMNRSS